MIPFIDDMAKAGFDDSIFSLIDETLQAATLPDPDFNFADLLTPEVLMELDDTTDAEIHAAITGLNCFVSGCTEHCAKSHLSPEHLSLDEFSSYQFQAFPQAVAKTEEPEEVEPYTPFWDHCYYLPLAQVKAEPQDKTYNCFEENAVESATDSDEEDSDSEHYNETNDDYYVDVESLPNSPPPRKRPVGRPRIKREPVEDRLWTVNQIDRLALKRSLPSPSNPRPTKIGKSSLETSPSSSDSEVEWSSISRHKKRGNKIPLLESAKKQLLVRQAAASKSSKRTSKHSSRKGKRTSKGRSISSNNVKHNNAEKERRNAQRVQLMYLKDQLPIDKPNPPKVVVLNTAAAVVTQLRVEENELEIVRARLLKQKKLLLERYQSLQAEHKATKKSEKHRSHQQALLCH